MNGSIRLRLVCSALMLAFLASTVPIASGNAASHIDVKDTIKSDPYKVEPGGTLYIDLDRGNIEVKTSPRNVVTIELERSVDVEDRDDAKRLFEQHDYAFEQKDDDVFIRSRYDDSSGLFGRWRNQGKFKLRVIVRVPEAYNIDFTSGAGNIDIADLVGEVEGRTGAGNIDIGSIDGDVDVTSGSGNIQVAGVTRSVSVESGAGNINLRDLQGEVEAKTGAGNVTAYISRQPDGSSELESGAGNVTVFLGESIAVDVEAESGMGAASTDFPLEVEGKWMSKSFEGEVNGGGPDLYLRSGVGNVALKRR
ncbi:MAG: DUF4097 family beta strand repeat-containing protein [Rhodothermales bacterium]